VAPQYVVPYAVSNVVALLILAAAVWWPNVGRWAIALLFGYACVYNTWIGLSKPEEYQGFADLVWLDAYRTFITGYFKDNAGWIISAIAAGQGVIAVTIAAGKRALWVGVLGTCIFLLAIAPFGVGSAFPFSLTVSVAAIIVWRKLKNE